MRLSALLLASVALFSQGCGDDASAPPPDGTLAKPHVIDHGDGAAADPDAPPPPPMSWTDAWDLLADREDWSAATAARRRAAVDAAAARLPGFTLKGMESFASGGEAHSLAVFTHGRTGLEFCLVPGGTYVRGSPDDEPERVSAPPAYAETPHTVVLREGFLIGRTEVTQAAWEALMHANPSFLADAQRPVDSVSWEDARTFCERAGLALPTEAQWEFACRAGTRTAYSFGADPESLPGHAWFKDDSEGTTHRVAQRACNAFGLFDLHGNVLEWCEDVLAPYPRGAVADAVNRAETGDRACRGGSWFNDAGYCRSASRSGYAQDTRNSAIGFRVVAPLPAR